MNVEVVSIGDELLIGQTVNTNASWIGEQLLNIGIHLAWVTTVGDNANHLTSALQIAESRADVILVTGGLGPTHDDITKRVVAEYYDSPMEMNPHILEQVKERFRRRGIPMAKVNEGQALVPTKAEIIENDEGTAPGMIFTENGKMTVVMPGVPREMKSMMRRVVLPRLAQKLDGGVIRFKVLCTTGIPESTLYEQLGDIAEIEQHAKLAFLPSLQGVKIRMMVSADNEKAALEAIARAEQKIRAKVNSYIYADEQILLEEAIAKMLIERKMTLAVAESCTGGLLANKLTNIPGSSDFFERGIVSYSNRAKMELLSVPEILLMEHGAVSEPVARAMAEGVRTLAGTDFGVGITGIAGPSGGTPEKPVGTVFIACSSADKTVAKRFGFANDRLGNKERSVAAALNMLRKLILKIEE